MEPSPSIKTEPVGVSGIVQFVIIIAAKYGIDLDGSALIALIAAVLLFGNTVSRSQVVPNSKVIAS